MPTWHGVSRCNEINKRKHVAQYGDQRIQFREIVHRGEFPGGGVGHAMVQFAWVVLVPVKSSLAHEHMSCEATRLNSVVVRPNKSSSDAEAHIHP
jgi:hypothetical protein